MARDVCNCYFLFWASFCPFTPVTPKKMKKAPGDIIILYKSTKNPDHMLYYY